MKHSDPQYPDIIPSPVQLPELSLPDRQEASVDDPKSSSDRPHSGRQEERICPSAGKPPDFSLPGRQKASVNDPGGSPDQPHSGRQEERICPSAGKPPDFSLPGRKKESVDDSKGSSDQPHLNRQKEPQEGSVSGRKPPAGPRVPRPRRFSPKKLLLGTGIFFCACLLLFLLLIGRLIAVAPDMDSVTVSPTESATWICDSDGNYVRRLTLSDTNRDIVSLQDIPKALQQAVIAIEDARFYEHSGIDPRGILRAFWNGLTSGSFSEGASTITQQLIKNSVFTEWTQENSFADRFCRKVQEQYLAVQLEKKLSKEEILEDYLNTINFGAGCYGVQAASRRYFGKDVSELTLSEAAVLAAIPQNPSGCSPIDFPETNQKRQQQILANMLEQGYITPREQQEALADDVYARVQANNETWEEQTIYTYYEDALIDQVTEALTEELGYSREQAGRAVYSGGLRIWSAQDAALQQICEEEFENPANFPADISYGIDYALSIQKADGEITHYGSENLRSYIRSSGNPDFDLLCTGQEEALTYTGAFRNAMLSEAGEGGTVLGERLTLSPQPQASLVLIEQETGFVRAIVGGRGEKTASLTLNRASDTVRQPGSTFKILTAYAPALDRFGQTLTTLYENEPCTYEDGTPVSNWDLTDYTGEVTIREAITRSINVAAVRCLAEITPRAGFACAQQFGISTLVDEWESQNGTSDVILPLALGGITNGVTNLELCAAYAAIANGGLYAKPLFFTKILDRHGNVLLDYSERASSVPAAGSAVPTAGSLIPAADSAALISGSAIPAAGSLIPAADSAALIFRSAGSTAGSAVPAVAPAAPAAANHSGKEENAAGFTRVISEDTAFLLTSAMQDVIASPEGTAYGTIQAAGQPAAGKTGTTSDYRDIWFVGYTPLYTCSIWGGFDNNQSLPADSRSYSKTLWSSVMSRIHAALPAAEFVRPDTIASVLLCRESLLPARNGVCPSAYTEYFAEGTQPEGLCTLHEPEPETEELFIYQDLLEQLLPETERMTEDETQAEEKQTGNTQTEEKQTESMQTEEKQTEEEQTGNTQTEEKQTEKEQTGDTQTGDTQTGESAGNHTETGRPGAAPDESDTETETSDSSWQESTETSSLEDLLSRLRGQGFSLP